MASRSEAFMNAVNEFLDEFGNPAEPRSRAERPEYLQEYIPALAASVAGS